MSAVGIAQAAEHFRTQPPADVLHLRADLDGAGLAVDGVGDAGHARAKGLVGISDQFQIGRAADFAVADLAFRHLRCGPDAAQISDCDQRRVDFVAVLALDHAHFQHLA